MDQKLVEQKLINQALEACEREMPENVARHQLGPKRGHYASFPFERGYMQNCDCDGTGPKEKFFMGRYVYYTRRSLLEWLRARMKVNL